MWVTERMRIFKKISSFSYDYLSTFPPYSVLPSFISFLSFYSCFFVFLLSVAYFLFSPFYTLPFFFFLIFSLFHLFFFFYQWFFKNFLSHFLLFSCTFLKVFGSASIFIVMFYFIHLLLLPSPSRPIPWKFIGFFTQAITVSGVVLKTKKKGLKKKMAAFFAGKSKDIVFFPSLVFKFPKLKFFFSP